MATPRHLVHRLSVHADYQRSNQLRLTGIRGQKPQTTRFDQYRTRMRDFRTIEVVFYSRLSCEGVDIASGRSDVKQNSSYPGFIKGDSYMWRQLENIDRVVRNYAGLAERSRPLASVHKRGTSRRLDPEACAGSKHALGASIARPGEPSLAAGFAEESRSGDM